MDSQLKKIRMADAKLTVLKPDKTPLANQEVAIEQTGHKFLFGTAAFDLLPLTNAGYQGEQMEQAEERARKLTALFNAATLPFYWARFEPQFGKPMTGQLKEAARWCVDHGLLVKGHPLCWHTLAPEWLHSMSNSAIRQAQIARIQREVSDFRGLVDMWDVVNEAVIMPIFDRYDNGPTRLCRQMGRINMIKALFDAARATNPSAILLINDFDVSPAYGILVEGCLELGVSIDAIGIQSHMHQGYWGVEKTLKTLDQFSRFRIPIHFTETTLVSGRLMPPGIVDLNDYQPDEWPTTPEGEDRQAEQAIQHYTTLFAHPLVEGITWWDMSDGGWLNAPGGLIRKDGSNKPAYEELLKLVKSEWWISSFKGTTDDAGSIDFTGVLGEYELTFDRIRRPFSIARDNDSAIEVQL